MKKRFLCLTLGLLLTVSQVAPVGAATRKEQLKQDKAAAQSSLRHRSQRLTVWKTRNRHFPLKSISWILIWLILW